VQLTRSHRGHRRPDASFDCCHEPRDGVEFANPQNLGVQSHPPLAAAGRKLQYLAGLRPRVYPDHQVSSPGVLPAAMKIVRLEIENFRAVRYASLTDLNDTVVVAGPNGCGKSCLFDAIRLVKSIYGGYQKNEWQQWFGEFQIDLQKEAQLLKLFHDRSRAVRVSARFHLSESETEYLRSNCFELCKTLLWAQVSPGGRYTTEKSSPSLASQLREHRDKVEADAQSGAKENTFAA
jgi:hypothetical protein